MSLSKAFKTTDKIYSQYIRLKYSNKEQVSCITCGVIKNWKEMDAGHYISRSYKSTRYYDKNVHPQCYKCNRFNEGMKDVYALKLIELYGKGILEELNEKKNQIKKYTEDELKSLRKKIRQFVNN